MIEQALSIRRAIKRSWIPARKNLKPTGKRVNTKKYLLHPYDNQRYMISLAFLIGLMTNIFGFMKY